MVKCKNKGVHQLVWLQVARAVIPVSWDDQAVFSRRTISRKLLEKPNTGRSGILHLTGTKMLSCGSGVRFEGASWKEEGL